MRNGAAFRCLEAVGQAISYAMNTQISTSPLIGLYVYPQTSRPAPCVITDPSLISIVSFALMGASLLPMLKLVNTTPDRIPADVILEGQEQQQEKLQELKEEKA